MKKYYPPHARSTLATDIWRPDRIPEESRSEKTLWLDRNENNDPDLREVVWDVFKKIPLYSLSTYPDSSQLYRKLAGYLAVNADQILLSSGSDGAIRAAYDAYVLPGDRVVHTEPTFAMYSVYDRIYAAEAIVVTYRKSSAGPVLNVAELIQTIERNTPKLVCLPNPDSPSGTVISGSNLQKIINVAGEVGALMLVDEAYYPFYLKTVLGWINEYPHLMVVRSASKAWGLAGVRIGYAVSSPQVSTELRKVMSMYETSTVAVKVFEGMLDKADDVLASVERLELGKIYFLNAMEELGYKTIYCHGNFLHIAFGDREKVVEKALSKKVYPRWNIGHPVLQGFCRFSATTCAQFEPVVDAIRRVS